MQKSSETISAQELATMLQRWQGLMLLDVREPAEFQLAKLDGAQLFSLAKLLATQKFSFSPQETIICYCASGVRSTKAVTHLRNCGYLKSFSLQGGIKAWQDAGLLLQQSKFSVEELARYQRQILLPEVGALGQEKLRQGKVLVVGAGGLGSPAALYLAAAGVGTLGLIDSDVVELSNLQRQIVHSSNRIGIAKVDSAAHTLHQLNANCTLNLYHERLEPLNAPKLLTEYDIIIDGSDNLPTRYLLNDVCWDLGKPLIHGSVYRFEGRVTVFQRGKSACYRCLHPEPPPAESIPSCQEAGVLGVVPGLIGILQATEALKLLLHQGAVLLNRLLLYNALSMRFSELELTAKPECSCQQTDIPRDRKIYWQGSCQKHFASL